ncbi:hypothetical protein Plhal304r1_c055g0141341 [Plasmopara halstedii]
MRPSYQSCVADEKGGDCLGRCHPYDSLDISGNDLLTSNDNSALSLIPNHSLLSICKYLQSSYQRSWCLSREIGFGILRSIDTP